MNAIDLVPVSVKDELGHDHVHWCMYNLRGLATARQRANDSTVKEPQRQAYVDLVALIEGGLLRRAP